MIFGVKAEYNQTITDRLLYELFRYFSGDNCELICDGVKASRFWT